MRFEHEGVSLWYGTPDAPAPSEMVQIGTDLTLTVGVQPMSASNKVELLYRVNQGPTETLAVNWLRNDTSHKTQYFRVHLPPFRAGDMVEYTALCRRAGRQVVPRPEEAQHFASSFRVVGTDVTATSGPASRPALMEDPGMPIGSSEGTPSRARAISSPMTAALPALQGSTSRETGMSDAGDSVTYSIAGRLLNQETGMPLVGFAVRASDLDAGATPQDLGYDITNGNGLFSVVYTVPHQPSHQRMEWDSAGRRFRLRVENQQAKELYKTEVRVKEDQSQTLEVRVPIPKPPTPTLAELASTARLGLSQPLLSALARNGIRTLADIREAGGISHLANLSVAADHPAVRTLEAHANLSVLFPDAERRSTLIQRGYTSISDIANVSRADFVAAVGGQLGDIEATQVHVSARAQADFLNNTLTALRTDLANGLTSQRSRLPEMNGREESSSPEDVSDLLSNDCGCKDCETALNPLAYLADLLDYAVKHLKNNNAPITLQFLSDTFHQPFGDLSASCKVVDTQVRQVRICIEVLRSYLQAVSTQTQEQKDALAAAEKQYRLETYTTLLNKIGTSYEELRLARTATPEQRKALADRLAIDLDPGGPDHLADLLLDPAADPSQPQALTEQALEVLFGLVDTTRHPLSDGVTLGDTQGQIHCWNLDGVEWGRNTDSDGLIYLSLWESKDPTVPVFIGVNLYRNQQRTEPVAFGSHFLYLGPVQLLELHNSGLSGSIDIAYTADNTAITLQSVSELLSWQLEHLRTLWTREDGQRQTPIIDPDLIGLADLRDPTSGPVSALWQDRHSQVTAKRNTLKSENPGNSRTGFDAILQEILGVQSADLLAWDDQRTQGTDISGLLDQHHLSLDAFLYLVRFRKLLDSNTTVLSAEWEDVYSILTQAWKRSNFPTWLTQERDPNLNLTLGPDFFQIPTTDSSFELQPWLAIPDARREWQDTLQSRIDQQQALIQALQEAVSSTEEITLPHLRDALILATDAAGSDLDAKATWLADRLLIDTKDSGCQKTTRIAQALETIQDILFSTRTGQLDPSLHLILDNSDSFDEEWRWIGTYATWRAAMLVFLYPENVLLPSLRRWQTPAFRNIIKSMRSNLQLTQGDACSAALAYSDYFRDVCSLTVEASCEALAGISGDQCMGKRTNASQLFFYMFARSRGSNKVYWSASTAYMSWLDRMGYTQTPWEPIPQLENVVNIIGAVPYQVTSGQRFIYLFACTREEGKDQLVFIRYDLEKQTAWTDLKPLDPPKDLDDNGQATIEVSTFTPVVKQRSRMEDPPHIAIRLPSGRVTTRYLNRDGTNWEAADWQVIIDPRFERGSRPELYAMVESSDNSFYLFFSSSLDGPITIDYQQFSFRTSPSGGSRTIVFAETTDDTGRTGITGPTGGNGRNGGNGGNGKAPSSNDSGTLGIGTWVGAFLMKKLNPGRDPYKEPELVYAFWRDQQDVLNYAAVHRISPADWLGILPCPWKGMDGLQRLAIHCGFSASAVTEFQFLAYDRLHEGRTELWQSMFMRNSSRVPYDTRPGHPADDSLAELAPARIAPLFGGPFNITQGSSSDRRSLTEAAFQANALPLSILAYLEEAYYFVPMYLALRLQASREYVSALDWFRLVYDYTMPADQQKIYYGLRQEENLPPDYHRQADWLRDPLNPHAIAATRRNTYTRFTLMALVRCFLDFADAEFTRDTAESVQRARILYKTALDLLDKDALRQEPNACTVQISSLQVHIDDPAWRPVWGEIKRQLADIADGSRLRNAVDGIKHALESAETPAAGLTQARALLSRALAEQPRSPSFAAVLAEKAERMATSQAALLRFPTVAQITEQVGARAGEDFQQFVSLITSENGGTLGVERTAMSQSRRELLALAPRPDGVATSPAPSPAADGDSSSVVPIYPGFVPGFTSFCIPPNAVLQALRLHAELNLYKIRHCRNIAGLERQLEPYASSLDGQSSVAMIGTAGALSLPRPGVQQPTPYRYAVLIERAKQLVNLAQQVETAFLSALEKRDAESYSLLKARQDVELTQAGVRLQDLRVEEAQAGVTLAQLQQQRAQIQVNHYQQLLDQGLSGLEIANLEFLRTAADFQAAAAIMSFTAAAQAGFSLSSLFTSEADATAHIASGLSEIGASLNTQATLLSNLASYERRAQEWEFQQGLAQQDVRIAGQQIAIASDHVSVTQQELLIAGMQADHAQTIADFLANKFTNAELYDWMSNILEGVYSFFLQQATAMAQLAASQLAFERQTVPPPFIQADYWEVPTDVGASGSAGSSTPDRRGLTGSARLLQDIYQLDQYAFDTNKRKLQLTKTISLALLAPAEFQRFRETGVMTFATPMELFDRDFPGHYLRLIRRVRTSVIALIQPNLGIRATLLTTGVSHVVIGGDLFQNVVVRRDPELVALSSPQNATGLFELDVQSDMLLPFEAMGVDTNWEFRMPRAANLFDYRTIADVLITIEYTALHSFDYQQQVLQMLKQKPELSANMPFSFRQRFADQWYDLHNPGQVAPPNQMIVRFTTQRDDFPPNLEDLRIRYIVLYFARASGQTFEVSVDHLSLTEQGGSRTPGSSATSVDGMINTRLSSGAGWVQMIGKTPFGEWELDLSSDPNVQNHLKNEEIEDILFVITYSGRTPQWPG